MFSSIGGGGGENNFSTPVLFLLLDGAVRESIYLAVELYAAWPVYDEPSSFCQYMKIARFYATGCLYVSRFGWLTFFIIEASYFHSIARSFAHNCFSFLIILMFLQGGRAFALTIAHLKDPELRKLAADLPLRTIEAKAPSTTDRYSRAFQKFREWSSPYNEVVCLPSDEISVALYLESLIQGGSPYSSLESACYGINWAHNLYGFQSPCDSKLVKNVLEAAKRGLAKPVSKKEPVTPAMILDICNRFAGPNANLSDLRLATICVTAYTAFLRYNELASLRCCDVSSCDSFLKIYVSTKAKWMFMGPFFALCIFIRLPLLIVCVVRV